LIYSVRCENTEEPNLSTGKGLQCKTTEAMLQKLQCVEIVSGIKTEQKNNFRTALNEILDFLVEKWSTFSLKE
jgi:hypothetical protein